MSTFGDMMKLIAPHLWEVESLSALEFNDLSAWFEFYFRRGTTVVLTDRELTECHGIAVMKLFSRLEQWLDDFVHEPSGRFVEVLAACFPGPGSMQLCMEEFKKVWGPQEIVIWERGAKKTGLTPRMYRWDQYERLVRKWEHLKTREHT
jgi:hypothetical protein